MTIRVTAPPQRRTATEELVGARDSARSASVDSARDLAALAGSVQRRSGAAEALEALPNDDAIRATAASGLSGPGQPLPHQSTLQPLFGGHSLASLRVYSDERAVDAADSLGAQAYTYKGRIALRPGASLAETAHESAHALLEQDGIAPREALGPMRGPHEQLAERVAQAASDGQPVAPLLDEAREGSLPESGPGGSVQRVIRINPTARAPKGAQPLLAKSIEQLPQEVQSKLKYSEPGKDSTFMAKFNAMLESGSEYIFDNVNDLIIDIDERHIREPNVQMGVILEDSESKNSTSYEAYRKLRKKENQPIEQVDFQEVDLPGIAKGMDLSWKDNNRSHGNYFDFEKPTSQMNCFEFALLLALKSGYLSQQDVSSLAGEGGDVSAVMLSAIKSEAVLLKPEDYKECRSGDIIFLNAPEFHTGICVGGNSVMQLGSNTGGVKQTTIDEMRKSYLQGESLCSLTDTFMLGVSLQLGAEEDKDLGEIYHYFDEAHMFKQSQGDWISIKSRIDQGMKSRANDAERVRKYLDELGPAGEKLLPAPVHRGLRNFVDIKVGRAPRERWIGRVRYLAKQKAKLAPK